MAVDGAKLTGFKYDKTNTYLEVWVRGTNCARFDDATADLTLITNGLTIDSGGITVDTGQIAITDTTNSTTTGTGSIQTDGGFGVVLNTFIGGSLWVDDKLTFDDRFYHAAAPISAVEGALTISADDVGKIYTSDSDGQVYTLPATGAGMVFTFINLCTDDACKVSIAPNDADKIMGLDVSGTDSYHWINTKVGSTKGDMVKLLGDGDLGWYVMEQHGTWDVEA